MFQDQDQDFVAQDQDQDQDFKTQVRCTNKKNNKITQKYC